MTPDNPSAFPCVWKSFSGDDVVSLGMTLRDHLAEQAMGIFLAHESAIGATVSPSTIAKISSDSIASASYKLADSMLAAREEPNAKT